MVINTGKIVDEENVVVLIKDEGAISKLNFSPQETDYIKSSIEKKKNIIILNRFTHQVYVVKLNPDKEKSESFKLEEARKSASTLCTFVNKEKIGRIFLTTPENNSKILTAFAEGLALKNYQYLNFFSEKEDKKNTLDEIIVDSDIVGQDDISELTARVEGVYFTRDLINEPVATLTAEKLASEASKLSDNGINVTIFDKKKIEELKMGGLLGVNRGSIDPPTFSILEWLPENAINDKPIVLVGKGVVYDTGGLSLKPTPSMDTMKSDMSGAAAVIGILYTISKLNIPVKVIGLIPATDNRPDGNAYTPGDVLTMYNGKTVEVLNTDAEGRLILADAISYASKYGPELIIDIATLTGAAAVAIGKEGVVAMGNASRKYFEQLKVAGETVYERIAEFPFWDEYAEGLKSTIADMKNIGNREGGAISAGKFLEKFAEYPYIHVDIAGPAFLKTNDSYRGIGATGVGVRLLSEFFKNYSQTSN